ncbi:carbohydrate ABC transporter permease [Microlunatus parietis]|uniref:Putative chitobiose transport system permease protein n=1 Tax=Microlunatus parietis TaxID=682979 RepID=A0A7Y9L9L1_9ACTN|nr:sugar ABC transporter permease [Microlunatus parietis]NYE69707.1 putative chitobiose transport system permease protein [Microlunatus parietis]
MALTAAGLARRSGGPGRVVGQRWWTPYLFLSVGLVLYAAMFAWPAVIAIQLAFSRYTIINPISFVGLANFQSMGADPRFWHALGNSLLFLIMFLPLSVVVPLLLALLVNIPLRGIQAFRMAYYLPVITSMVAVAVGWRYVFNREGVVNWLLSLVGLGPIDFLLNTAWALPTVVLLEAWKSAGLFMMIYLAGLQSVPRELIEAARVDGASAVRRLWHVIIPGLLPTFAVTLTLSMLEAMRAFESVYVLTRGGPLDSTLTLGYYIWSKAFQDYDMGYASAMGLVLWAIMIILAMANLLVTRRRDR